MIDKFWKKGEGKEKEKTRRRSLKRTQKNGTRKTIAWKTLKPTQIGISEPSQTV